MENRAIGEIDDSKNSIWKHEREKHGKRGDEKHGKLEDRKNGGLEGGGGEGGERKNNGGRIGGRSDT